MPEANLREPAPAPLLPAPPAIGGEDGTPRLGLYSGAVTDASFSNLKEPYAPSFLERRLTEKKWQYVLVTTKEMMLALAIVDTGYLASGICGVFDRESRRLLANENPVLPPVAARISEQPAEAARLVGPGLRASIRRSGAEIAVLASWGHTDVDLTLDLARAPTPMTAIAGVGAPGRFDFTQKTVLVPARGEVRAGNIRFAVQGDFASLDYTHGYLLRETAWRWAFASGRAGGRLVAFNFSEGFMQGDGENVVWIDGEPRRAGSVSFSFEGKAPLSPWHIRGPGGMVDLVFHPEGYRAQDLDLKLIASRYVQPFGVFSGTLHGVPVEGLAGVTEDHTARW